MSIFKDVEAERFTFFQENFLVSPEEHYRWRCALNDEEIERITLRDNAVESWLEWPSGTVHDAEALIRTFER